MSKWSSIQWHVNQGLQWKLIAHNVVHNTAIFFYFNCNPWLPYHWILDHLIMDNMLQSTSKYLFTVFYGGFTCHILTITLCWHYWVLLYYAGYLIFGVRVTVRVGIKFKDIISLTQKIRWTAYYSSTCYCFFTEYFLFPIVPVHCIFVCIFYVVV